MSSTGLMHTGAVICFALAILSYLTEWGGAGGFGALGVVFEVIAWIIWINRDDASRGDA